ncbi:hypothetical protein [Cryobacterium sandaracinum]|uniref:hypothetical protein n=1 Tax=Cryobacterium sandaracinum TaxID=1259247 RepID=UPI001F544734|nr:hypothetical protein [Cryobacterium sandaracinum]
MGSPPGTHDRRPDDHAPRRHQGLSATLTALGVREHVLQTVRAEGARPAFAARLKAHLEQLG